MSSREIADVVELRHDNVKRTINSLVIKGLIESPQVEEIPTATRPGKEYRVGKRDSYVIVAQLSPEFTARLVDRWQELEAQQPAKPQVPQSFAEALRLAADTQEQLEQATIERDSVIDTTTRHRQTLAEYARQFPRINSMKIKSDLKRAGYLYSSNKRNNPYRVYGQYRDELFVEKTDEVYSVITICPTEKGKEVINRLYTEGHLAMRS